MDTDTMIRELERVEEKYKHYKVFTGQLNVAQRAHDIRKRLEELKPYEDTGLDPEQIVELKERDTAKIPDYEGDGYADGHMVYDTWICPNCGEHYEVDYDDYDFCPKCGQRIKKHMDVNEKRFEEHETQWKRSFMKRFERRM